MRFRMKAGSWGVGADCEGLCSYCRDFDFYLGSIGMSSEAFKQRNDLL